MRIYQNESGRYELNAFIVAEGATKTDAIRAALIKLGELTAQLRADPEGVEVRVLGEIREHSNG